MSVPSSLHSSVVGWIIYIYMSKRINDYNEVPAWELHGQELVFIHVNHGTATPYVRCTRASPNDISLTNEPLSGVVYVWNKTPGVVMLKENNQWQDGVWWSGGMVTVITLWHQERIRQWLQILFLDPLVGGRRNSSNSNTSTYQGQTLIWMFNKGLNQTILNTISLITWLLRGRFTARRKILQPNPFQGHEAVWEKDDPNIDSNWTSD